MVATLGSANPGDTIQLKDDCSSQLVIRNRNIAEPGVTIDATGRRFPAGILILNSYGIKVKGGTFENPAPAGRAADVRQGGRIEFDGGTFTNAYRGMVIGRTQGATVRNSTFTKLQSDGIDIAGPGDNGLIENNRFSDFNPVKSRCVLPDGSTVIQMPKGKCKGAGGDFRDGDHADAVQTWGGWGTLIVRNNIVKNEDGSAVQTMGITTHGKGAPKRMDIIGNELHTTYSSAIVNASESGTVSGNTVKGDGVNAAIRLGPQVKGCNNRVPDDRRTTANKGC